MQFQIYGMVLYTPKLALVGQFVELNINPMAYFSILVKEDTENHQLLNQSCYFLQAFTTDTSKSVALQCVISF